LFYNSSISDHCSFSFILKQYVYLLHKTVYPWNKCVVMSQNYTCSM